MTVDTAAAPPQIDIAGTRDGIPERFAPQDMRGQLIEAEHLGRYRWAAAIAAGRRVLDAGCGAAYGSALLARAGAAEVVGVDIAESVLEAMRPQMPAAVRLDAGDLRDLAYEDAIFDLVVCFEVIEHFEDPFRVLDELTRVLAPDGVLLVSSPNRAVYPPGNPHHYHEFLPDELDAELRRRLRNVRLMRQHDYVAAAILDDDTFAAARDAPLDGLPLHKLVEGEADRELFTLAIAGDGPLPELPPLAMLTSHIALDDWLKVVEYQEAALQAHRQRARELEDRLAEHDALKRRLVDAEQELAALPDLEAELEQRRRELDWFRDRLEETTYHLERSRRAHEAVLNSPSWRMTASLRAVKRALRRRG